MGCSQSGLNGRSMKGCTLCIDWLESSCSFFFENQLAMLAEHYLLINSRQITLIMIALFDYHNDQNCFIIIKQSVACLAIISSNIEDMRNDVGPTL